MFTCPACSKPNNMCATACQHCGTALAAARPPGSAAPRVAAPCPKCSHCLFLVVAPFNLPDVENTGRVMQLAVFSSVQGWKVQSAGSFRAHVCLQCGYTEWYANDLEALAALAGKAPNVSAVEAKPSDPHR